MEPNLDRGNPRNGSVFARTFEVVVCCALAFIGFGTGAVGIWNFLHEPKSDWTGAGYLMLSITAFAASLIPRMSLRAALMIPSSNLER